MCRLDLRDAYFYVPFSKKTKNKKKNRKYVRFFWSGNLCEFICLCFGIGPAPRVFTKLLKIQVALLHRLNMRLIIYLGDVLVFGRTTEAALMSCQSVIYILQFLCDNSEEIDINSTSGNGIFGNDNKSQGNDLITFLLEQKTENIREICLSLFRNPKTKVLLLTKVLGNLTSSTQAIIPARHLQQKQIKTFQLKNSYQATLV